MKKAYLLFITALIAATSFGQSETRTVQNSAGGSFTNGATTMLVSIGEPIIGMVQIAASGLSQGFLTGSKTIVATATSGIDYLAIENATVYPNPFSNHLTIHSEETNIHVELLNMLGQPVYSGVYPEGGIELPELNAGIYIIHATANQQSILNTKLLKQ